MTRIQVRRRTVNCFFFFNILPFYRPPEVPGPIARRVGAGVGSPELRRRVQGADAQHGDGRGDGRAARARAAVHPGLQ